MEERRKLHRSRSLKAGKIIYNRDLFSIDCTVRNFSDTGASLDVTSSSGVPDTFELHIPLDDIRRNCRVAWIKPKKIGVEFV
jgi:hypothetical protein